MKLPPPVVPITQLSKHNNIYDAQSRIQIWPANEQICNLCCVGYDYIQGILQKKKNNSFPSQGAFSSVIIRVATVWPMIIWHSLQSKALSIPIMQSLACQILNVRDKVSQILLYPDHLMPGALTHFWASLP